MLVDILIIIFCLSSAYRGMLIGFMHQFFSAIGFFGGLFLGSLLQPQAVKLAHTALSRSLILVTVVMGCALIGLTIGEYLGVRLRNLVTWNKQLQKADNGFGAVLSIASALLSVWLLAALVLSLPYSSAQTAVKESAIVKYLNEVLPPAPNIISKLGHLIDANGFPDVFIGDEPAPAQVNLPALGNLATAVNDDKNSVLRIRGQGCGGIVSGSGFVVGTDLVATNAHVVAGIAQPYVQDSNNSYKATVVWFDPNLDFAVLRVRNLPEAALSVANNTSVRGTAAAVLGYPGGGNFSAGGAAILDEFDAVGRNIYGGGHTSRDVYELKANIIPGNSGGPLINAGGQVIGVVFAESTTYNQVGYALTSVAIHKEISQALVSSGAVDTGSCAE